MDINYLINEILCYALEKNIMDEFDFSYNTNMLLYIFKLNYFKKENVNVRQLDDILNDLVMYAIETNIIYDTDTTSIDNFKAKIMDSLMEKPSVVARKFKSLYSISPILATDYLYKLSVDVDYVKSERIKKNIVWAYPSKYGTLDITINLSKPEKDVKNIIKAATTNNNKYPNCQLCIENEGYYGNITADGRSNLRLVDLKINNEDWYFQYSPYAYFNEHSIVLYEEHVKMMDDSKIVCDLLGFIDLFPHYFIGSNAGLPIVGGSILSHKHYQAGKYSFPIEKANIKFIKKIASVDVYKVNWPLSTIRLVSKNKEDLIKVADNVFINWNEYENVELGIINNKNNIHNAITPIARFKNDHYEVDLVLRNNITSEKYADGVFHPHPDVQNIKKENIGLIEAMGLGILPPRLKKETEMIASILDGFTEYANNTEMIKHLNLINEIKMDNNIYQSTYDKVLHHVGRVFERVLEDAGVFKQDDKGQEALERFINNLE